MVQEEIFYLLCPSCTQTTSSKETQSSIPHFHDSTFTHCKRNEEAILDIFATVAKCGRRSTMLLLLIFYQKKHKLWKKNKKPLYSIWVCFCAWVIYNNSIFEKLQKPDQLWLSQSLYVLSKKRAFLSRWRIPCTFTSVKTHLFIPLVYFGFHLIQF